MKIFNIRDFGARICDAPQTDAIQGVIDACVPMLNCIRKQGQL